MFDSCCLQVAYAKVLDLVAQERFNRVHLFFRRMIGNDIQQVSRRVAGRFPAYHIAVHEKLAVVFCAGTSNVEQAALQGLQGNIPQRNFGAFSTMPLWNELASLIVDELNDLNVGTRPILLVAHSYGAAGMTVLAARLRLADPERHICLLGYGSPKPGDDRLIKLLENTKALFICGTDDIVTIVPLQRSSLDILGLNIPLFFHRIWKNWALPVPRLYIDPDGNRIEGAQPPWDIETVRAIIQQAINQQNINVVVGHFLSSYVSRLRMQCEGPCFPIGQTAWNILFLPDAVPFIAGPNLVIAPEANVDPPVERNRIAQIGVIGNPMAINDENVDWVKAGAVIIAEPSISDGNEPEWVYAGAEIVVDPSQDE